MLGRVGALVVVFGLFAVLVPEGKFLQARNVENILVQSAVVALCAVGATMVIISGGIDLSAGSVIALAVVVVAWVLELRTGGGGEGAAAAGELLLTAHPVAWPLVAAAAGVAAATLCGLLNGCLVAGLRIVPFVVTLGGLQVYRGLAKGMADEKNIYPEETWIDGLMDPVRGSAERAWMLFPPGVWITLLAALAGTALLRYTRFGRHVFAVGSNPLTARLCGVGVGRTKVCVYALAGFFAGLAGLMQYAYLGVGQPTTAVGYELFVIAAVVIGGGSLMGGEGTVAGTVVGALIIAVLAAGGIQMGWPKWIQEIVTGGIIVAAVALDQWRHRRGKGK